jgi:hypothetical protein
MPTSWQQERSDATNLGVDELDDWRDLLGEADSPEEAESAPESYPGISKPTQSSSLYDPGDLTWQALADCKEQTYLFFSDHVCTPECDKPAGCTARKEKGKHLRVAKAKAICRMCPVLLECKEWALRTKLEYGVAGMLTEKERTRILKQRRYKTARLRKTRLVKKRNPAPKTRRMA